MNDTQPPPAPRGFPPSGVPSELTMQQQRWTDGHIRLVAFDAASRYLSGKSATPPAILTEIIEGVMKQVRDEKDAELADLRAQLAAQSEWEPVPDGYYYGLEVGEKGSEIYMDGIDPYGHKWPADAFLGDDLRLCRRRIVELEAQLVSVSRELASTDNADRYYRGFNDGFEHANTELSALRAQLAAQSEWEPLGKGIYWQDNEHTEAVIIGDDAIGFYMRTSKPGTPGVEVNLSKSYRLCRLRTPAVRDAGTGEADE